MLSKKKSPQQADYAVLPPEDRLLCEKLMHYFCNQKKTPLAARQLANSILLQERLSGRNQVTTISRVPSRRPRRLQR
jgi:hypothetical protein